MRQPGRFGVFNLSGADPLVNNFTEKPEGGETPWINGGFFVLEPGVFDYLKDDQTVWEKAPLEHLAAAGQLAAYRHTGFWQPMDTLRDRNMLEERWQAGKAEWKLWDQTPAAPVTAPELETILAAPLAEPAGRGRPADTRLMPSD